MAQPPPGKELCAIPADDPASFLSAVLQGMQTQRGDRGGFGLADHAKDAALLAQLVAVQVEVGVGKVHHGPPNADSAAQHCERAFGVLCRGRQARRAGACLASRDKPLSTLAMFDLRMMLCRLHHGRITAMRWLLGPLALIAGIGVAQAQSGAPPLAAGEVLLHIETVGVADPDAATVNLTVRGRGQDDVSARAALKDARGRVMAQLAKLGVAASAVAAGEVNVNEDYGSAAAAAAAAAAGAAAAAAGDAASAAAGETADDLAGSAVDAAAEAIPRMAIQTLTVTVTDLTKLAAVEAVQTYGSTDDVMSYSRSRANFYTTDPKAAYGRAVQLALANARGEAEAYATAMGYRVVRVSGVSNAKPVLNLPDMFSMIGRAEARGTPGADEMKKLAGSVIAGAQIDYVIAPK
jgi:uncharacterized protein YggE